MTLSFTEESRLTSSALRAWLGMVYADPRRVVNAIFGEPGVRPWIQEAAEALGLEGFSTRQTEILTTFNSVLSVIRCTFGGGKTRLLLAIAWKSLQALGNTVKIVFAAPSLSVAQQFAHQLRKAAKLVAGEVIILGTDRNNEGGRLEDQCCDELLAELMQSWACFFSLLDDMADIVMGKLLETLASTSSPEFVVRRLLRILALRRQILVIHIYPMVHGSQAEILKRVRAICLTTTQATKVAAGLTSWTACLKAESFVVTLVDEYIVKGWEQVLGALAEADVAILVGDSHQGKRKSPYPGNATYEEARLTQMSQNWDAMQMAPAWQWAERNGTIYDLSETHRVGSPAFEFLQRAFPAKLGLVDSLARGNTCIIPLLLQDFMRFHKIYAGFYTAEDLCRPHKTLQGFQKLCKNQKGTPLKDFNRLDSPP